MRTVLAALCLVLASITSAHAQNGNIHVDADIGVTLSASPTSNLVPGQTVDLSLTATNYGPGVADVLTLQSSDILASLQFVHGSSDCGIVPVTFADDQGRPTSQVLRWNAVIGPPYFNAGDTVHCHLQALVLPTAPKQFTLSVGIPFLTDLNSANDTASVAFTLSASAGAAGVPGLPLGSRLLLIALIVTLTFLIIRLAEAAR